MRTVDLEYCDWCGAGAGTPCADSCVMAPNTNEPLSKQVGGQHYKDYAIQPIEFIQKNNIGYIEGNVIKYVCRHGEKNGRQDIEKAIHYLELLLDMKY